MLLAQDMTMSARDERPFLILHIGPPKTATTTLQKELIKLEKSQVLMQDNYHYAMSEFGEKYAGVLKLFDSNCHRELGSIRKSHNVTDGQNVTNVLRNVPCWKEVLHDLHQYRQNNTNLIFSSEVVSTQSLTMKRPWFKYGPFADWPLIRSTISKDWQIIIVLGYRRYVDWLPSAKQQFERWMPNKPKMITWPQYRGKAIEPIFPNFASPKFVPGPGTEIGYRDTEILLQMITNHAELPIKILNMHSNETIRTEFVCNILPMAATTCLYSRAKDTTDGPLPIVNPSQSLFYDALAMAAAKENLFDVSKIRRHKMVLAIEKYHKECLQKETQGQGMVAVVNVSVESNNYTNATGHGGGHVARAVTGTKHLASIVKPKTTRPELEFPLSCPTETHLTAFLENSLRKEQVIVPDFAKDPVHKESHRGSV